MNKWLDPDFADWIPSFAGTADLMRKELVQTGAVRPDRVTTSIAALQSLRALARSFRKHATSGLAT